MEPVKIVVINFGGTSSKVAYFENDRCLIKENIVHPVEAIRQGCAGAIQLSQRGGIGIFGKV